MTSALPRAPLTPLSTSATLRPGREGVSKPQTPMRQIDPIESSALKIDFSTLSLNEAPKKEQALGSRRAVMADYFDEDALSPSEPKPLPPRARAVSSAAPASTPLRTRATSSAAALPHTPSTSSQPFSRIRSTSTVNRPQEQAENVVVVHTPKSEDNDPHARGRMRAISAPAAPLSNLTPSRPALPSYPPPPKPTAKPGVSPQATPSRKSSVSRLTMSEAAGKLAAKTPVRSPPLRPTPNKSTLLRPKTTLSVAISSPPALITTPKVCGTSPNISQQPTPLAEASKPAMIVSIETLTSSLVTPSPKEPQQLQQLLQLPQLQLPQQPQQEEDEQPQIAHPQLQIALPSPTATSPTTTSPTISPTAISQIAPTPTATPFRKRPVLPAKPPSPEEDIIRCVQVDGDEDSEEEASSLVLPSRPGVPLSKPSLALQLSDTLSEPQVFRQGSEGTGEEIEESDLVTALKCEERPRRLARRQSYNLSVTGTLSTPGLMINGGGVFKKSNRVQIGSAVASEDLLKLGPLGSGNTGTVFKALWVPKATLVALKTVNVHNKAQRHQLIKELTTFLAISAQGGSCFVEFWGAFVHESKCTLVIEYMNRGCLKSALSRSGPLSEGVIAGIARQILLGLHQLHSQNQIHRDIKADNVLIDDKGFVKISDFGIVKQLDEGATSCSTFVGTMTHLSPERLRCESFSFPSDIWSFGITMHVLATGRSPFESDEFFHLLKEVADISKPLSLNRARFSPNFVDFLELCLAKDPSLRPSAAILLQHPFILHTAPCPWPFAAPIEGDPEELDKLAQYLAKVNKGSASHPHSIADRAGMDNWILSMAAQMGIHRAEVASAFERNFSFSR